MADSTELRELKTAYAAGQLLPFVGAGVSMSVAWTDHNGVTRRGPSWKELVDAAAKQLGFADPTLLRVRGEDLQILEYFKLRHDGELAPLTNWLVAELHAPDSVVAGNAVISALARLNKCSTFYTTNYDDYLERGLRLNGRDNRVVATEADIRRLLQDKAGNSDTCEIVKFHGDLNHPNDMVVTESDYRERLSLQATMDDRLRADLLGRVVLFVGYSFRDWNVSYLFHLLEKLHGSLPGSVTGRRGYITVEDPSDFEVQLFNNRRIGVIPIHSGDGRSSDIADLIGNITGATS